MEVRLAPEVEQQLNDLAGRAGVSAVELVRDVVTGYVGGAAEVGAMLDARYEELRSGRVTPINGDSFFEDLRLREQTLLKEKAT